MAENKEQITSTNKRKGRHLVVIVGNESCNRHGCAFIHLWYIYFWFWKVFTSMYFNYTIRVIFIVWCSLYIFFTACKVLLCLYRSEFRSELENCLNPRMLSGCAPQTLFNPNKTVVKMFVVMYDLRAMPAGHQTFLRQRTFSVPVRRDINNHTSRKALSHGRTLRYLVHLRWVGRHFISSGQKKWNISGSSDRFPPLFILYVSLCNANQVPEF